MFKSAHDKSCNRSNAFDTMFDDTKKPLYLGCKKFMKSSALVRLYNLKLRYGWSNTSFSKLLSIISDLLPDNNEIPTSLYEAKKTLDVEGDNVKVVVDIVVDGDCAIPILSEQGMYKMSQEVGTHILWPRHLVITDNIKMDYGEFTKDMTTFALTPIQNALVALRMVEHMGLYKHMESSKTLNLYKFVDTGSISCGSSKEERAQLLTARLLGIDYDQLLLISYIFGNHWTLVVINLTKGAAFWIDPLKNRVDPDVSEVVERSFNIMKKKKPNWRVVKIKDSPRAYTLDDIDYIRSE
ncbi:uncharacterized protein E5676_scaffold596G00420 [Cucumis melo var. makuwa]|uniref:Ubiquitin-like protease family profile domain-containing protein n=1 Tax=Cucumis melo var. makuwa TaxID=1194695 RepID=A0A5D3BM78_CUCMM|nr:uncharacterized protein E5676_scaffold596G00420 [Cucumis melo var. makuwa]